MDFENIQYEKKGHITYVTLDRPEVMNAINPPLHAELTQAWSDFIDDDDAWVAILTGAGDRAFCAGSDLKWRVEGADDSALRNPVHSPVHVLDRCYKPVIAAVNGYAIGGGLEMALRCDLIVAAQQAQFGLPEARRGLLADAGGVLQLPRRLPYHLAMGIFLTGRFFSADEAQSMGLVNEVLPGAQLLPRAWELARRIMQQPELNRRYARIIMQHGDTDDGAFGGNSAPVLGRLMALNDELETAIGAITPVFCHNDLVAENILDDGVRFWLIDWEYGGWNDGLYDLACLAAHLDLGAEVADALLHRYLALCGRKINQTERRRFAAWKCAALIWAALWGGVGRMFANLDFDYAAYSRERIDLLERAVAVFREI